LPRLAKAGRPQARSAGRNGVRAEPARFLIERSFQFSGFSFQKKPLE
jgi:hypothetical protein